MRALFLLFIIVPVVEMWLLITVGQNIGALATIGLVLLTAFIGVGLLRYQGAITLLRAQMKMRSGKVPAREMADGLFFAVGGALLLTPGFVTDAIGFACLIPGVRTGLIHFLMNNLLKGKSGAGMYSQFSGFQASGFQQHSGNASAGNGAANDSLHGASNTNPNASSRENSQKTRSGDVLEGNFERHDD